MYVNIGQSNFGNLEELDRISFPTSMLFPRPPGDMAETRQT